MTLSPKRDFVARTLCFHVSPFDMAGAFFVAASMMGCNAFVGDYVADLVPDSTHTDSDSTTASDTDSSPSTSSDNDSDTGNDTDENTGSETASNSCPYICVGEEGCSQMLGTPTSGFFCQGPQVCCQLEYEEGQFDQYCTDDGGCSGSCDGSSCQIYCGGQGSCSYACGKGGCTFVCADSKECKFVCDGGGCTVISVGEAVVAEFKCQSGHCDLYCMGKGGCVLDDCEAGGCSVEQCPSEIVDCGDKNAKACARSCP